MVAAMLFSPLATAGATFLILTTESMFEDFNIFPPMPYDIAQNLLNNEFHSPFLAFTAALTASRAI